MINEWNGLADLLANLITKYASELNIDQLPDPEVSYEEAKAAISDVDNSIVA